MRLRHTPESIADRNWRHLNAAALAGMLKSQQADQRAIAHLKDMENAK